MKLKTAVLLLIALSTTSCIKNEAEFEQILAIEDQRQACWRLVPFLRHSEPKIRTRAVQAMGRLQDSSCVDYLVRSLDDINHNVRIESAFALGQIGSQNAETPLIERLKTKEMARVKTRIIEALGKIGRERTVPVLLRLFASHVHELRAEAALAVGRMALRDFRHRALTDSVSRLLKDSDVEVRWRAAYSLMRIGENLAPNLLVTATEDNDSRVRMYALQALANLRDYAFLEPLGEALQRDRDWRVRVKAANGLGKFPLSLSANYLSLLNQAQPVRVAIIQAIGASAQEETGGYRQNSREHNFAKGQLERVFGATNGDSHWSSAEIGFALISYAKLLGEDAIQTIGRFTTHSNARIRARAVEALGETGAARIARTLTTAFDDTANVVRVAVLQALKNIEAPQSEHLYERALQTQDPVLVALAAEGLSADSLKYSIYSRRIVEAYQSLGRPVDPELATMIFHAMARFKEEQAVPVLEEALKTRNKIISSAAAEALDRITGEDYTTKIRQDKRDDYDYSPIFELEGAQATIHTERGDITIELFPGDAPLTVLNYVKLAEKGFYDDLVFHRVAPNFVIQDGDPRGDGWGSPGYAIRSEFNKRHFTRGTVGMASAGKDTEGSQFFVTHSVQPHLDGRYTVFGRVSSGMDIVDGIQEGDAIFTISIDH